MKFFTTISVIAIIGSAATSIKAQDSYRQKFNQLSIVDQEKIKRDATQKEEYDQLPLVRFELNDRSVTEFCKLLPRGLETLDPHHSFAKGKMGIELKRTELWARYLSCEDSLLYYEGHRFFNSRHYTSEQISSAISEIRKVMAWLVKQEEGLDSNQPKVTTAH